MTYNKLFVQMGFISTREKNHDYIVRFDKNLSSQRWLVMTKPLLASDVLFTSKSNLNNYV
jgi:hypothetical protein